MEKYQITKTIRFKLDIKNELAKSLQLIQEQLQIKPLVDLLNEIKEELWDILYFKDEDNKLCWNKKIKVKYTWLRTFLKNHFYENKDENSKTKSYIVADLKYAANEIENRWKNEWVDIVKQLCFYEKQPHESLTRKANIAQLINQLQRRSIFEFIKEFTNSLVATQISDLDNKINAFIDSLKNANEILKSYQKCYLPSQSNGLLVAGASLNYYTVNKVTKFEEQIKKEQNLLSKPLSSFEKNGKKEFEINQELLKIGLPADLLSKNLDDAYTFLKKWRAEKKSTFLEKVSKGELELSNVEEKGEFYLFNSTEGDFNECVKLSKEIADLNSKKMSKDISEEEKKGLKNKITTKKNERGAFFNKPKEKGQTKIYEKLCKFYKEVALKRGQFLTRIKAIEKEQNFAEQLKYWSIIVEKNGEHFVYLIPRDGSDNLKKGKKLIESNKEKPTGCTRIHYFESLTLRALRKLCFKSINNTFTSLIKDEFKKSNQSFPQYEQKLTNDKEKVEFYKKVLIACKKNGNEDFGLNLMSFNIDSVINATYATMEEFEVALQEICYVKTVITANEIEQKLIKEHKAAVFKISSYDINHNHKYENNNFTNKNHTDVWFDFWKNENQKKNYPLRLNPEIKIMWREAKQTRIDKYGEKSTLYDPNKKNRYLHDQFTLCTTFTENAHGKKFEFAFTDTQAVKVAIDDYNAKLKSGMGKYHYGIDRGTKELATLCIADFSEGIKNPQFPKLDIYRLQNKKYFFTNEKKECSGQVDQGFGGYIKNISYCLDKIDRNEYFEKIPANESACFDLTTAKLIKGKIILNGDLITFLNLKMIVAQRQIFELFHQGKITKQTQIKKRGSGFLSIYNNETPIYSDRTPDEKNNGIIIYRFTEEQKMNYEKIGELVVDQLNDYLQKLDEKEQYKNEPTIEKINHLRDSITANMVGIIKFLNISFPIKYIALENLDERKDDKQKFIESHFLQSETSISRRLEWSLYRSFQSIGLVPPSIKETILLKDEFFQQQFGIIKFVKTSGTSSNCPRCDFNSGKTGTHLVCRNVTTPLCGFSSKDNRKELLPLTNSDKVAAFNIAKRGL